MDDLKRAGAALLQIAFLDPVHGAAGPRAQFEAPFILTVAKFARKGEAGLTRQPLPDFGVEIAELGKALQDVGLISSDTSGGSSKIKDLLKPRNLQ